MEVIRNATLPRLSHIMRGMSLCLLESINVAYLMIISKVRSVSEVPDKNYTFYHITRDINSIVQSFWSYERIGNFVSFKASLNI